MRRTKSLRTAKPRQIWSKNLVNVIRVRTETNRRNGAWNDRRHSLDLLYDNHCSEKGFSQKKNSDEKKLKNFFSRAKFFPATQNSMKMIHFFPFMTEIFENLSITATYWKNSITQICMKNFDAEIRRQKSQIDVKDLGETMRTFFGPKRATPQKSFLQKRRRVFAEQQNLSLH